MERFLSRKFILAVLAAVVAFGNAVWGWGLTVEQVWQVLTPLLSFIGIEGVTDYTERRITAEAYTEGQ